MSKTLISPSPALKKGFASVVLDDTKMSWSGTLKKSAFLAAITFTTALVAGSLNLPRPLVYLAIPLLILAVVITSKPHLAKSLGLVYAAGEGLVLGIISDLYAYTYGGSLVVYALGLTAAIFFALLLVYATGLIKVSQNFKLAVAAATMGVAFYYLAAVLLSFFDVSVPLVASTSLYGIVFSFLVVCLASANLVIDFDFIERGVETGAPKHMEWFAAFGLLITLIWLYLEILRLLGKLRERR